MLSPMSWRVWRLGVGAVYELPKNVRRVGSADCVHRMSADVRIPSGHGGWEARSYMRTYVIIITHVIKNSTFGCRRRGN